MVMVSERRAASVRERGLATPRFGLLRLGTGNALAWVVRASRAKAAASPLNIQRLRDDAGSRPMRFVEVDGRLAPFCGFGIDAVVLLDKDKTKNWMLKVPLLRRYTSGEAIYAVSTLTRTIPTTSLHPSRIAA